MKIESINRAGDLLIAKLDNGKVFYFRGEVKELEREIHLLYFSSSSEFDKKTPEEYSKFGFGTSNRDRIPNVNCDVQKWCDIMHIREGDNVLELGPYYGFSTLKLSEMVGETGRVYSVDASRKIFDILTINMTMNEVKNVELMNMGVWSSRKEGLQLIDAGNKRKTFRKGMVPQLSAESVAVDTVDNVLKVFGDPKISILLSDTNGSELEALKGASKVLDQDKVRLAVWGYNSNDVVQLQQFLRERGFTTLVGPAHRVYAYKGY